MLPEKRALALWFLLTPIVSFGESADYSEAQLGEIWDQAIHILGGNANVVARWQDDINYLVVTDDEVPAVQQRVAEVFAAIETQVNLSIDLAGRVSVESYLQQINRLPAHRLSDCRNTDRCANFVVVLSDLAAMQSIASTIPLRDVYRSSLADQSAVCFFAPYQRASVILQALVFVKSDLPASLVRTCLNEEIYQSFGLFSDFENSRYFSFNNSVAEKQITPLDKHLLSTLYEFDSGTPVFAVVRRLIDRLESRQ